jgi:hypothetical protein
MIDIKNYGIIADGKTDDTAAIQQMLDDAGKNGGGEVNLPAGQYLVNGSLKIPEGVTLSGIAHSPVYIEPLIGTVILATGGRNNENGTALFELGNSAAVQGLTVYYPEQVLSDIVPYPWTFHMVGGRQHSRKRHAHKLIQRYTSRSRRKRQTSYQKRIRLRVKARHTC